MKRTILTTVSALAMLVAAPALAQSNNSNVSQTGSNNGADVTQSGSNASSTVSQSSDNNEATVRQSGDGASSTVSQSGANTFNPNNGADVTQIGDNDSTVSQTGSGAIANVRQEGTGNSSTVEQSGILASTGYTDEGVGLYDSTGVDQRGENNRSYVQQQGGSFARVRQDNRLGQNGGNDSDVYQGTGNGQAYVDQVGGANTALINQQTNACCGNPTPISTIDQMGELNNATIYQGPATGGSDATIIQRNASNESFITQDGQGPNPTDGSQALNEQTGSLNYSYIQQSAEGNDADIEQSGDNNDSWVYQTGLNNTATLVQSSSDNTSTISQSMNGNVANVVQGNP